MNRRIGVVVVVLAGAAAAVLGAAVLLSTPAAIPQMSYGAAEAIRSELAELGIEMSSPIRLSGDAAAEYCTFFAGRPPERCVSTELRGPGGGFLGNVHMVGTDAGPAVVLGVVQSDAGASQRYQISAVAGALVRQLVCDCWTEVSPGGFDSVRAWVDETARRHLEAGETTTASRIDGLPRPLLAEVTRNDGGHLWKILVGALP